MTNEDERPLQIAERDRRKTICLIGAVFASAQASSWCNDGWVYLAEDGLAIRCDFGWNYLYTANSLEELWYVELFAETDRDRYLVLDVPKIIERQQHYGFF